MSENYELMKNIILRMRKIIDADKMMQNKDAEMTQKRCRHNDAKKRCRK